MTKTNFDLAPPTKLVDGLLAVPIDIDVDKLKLGNLLMERK